MKELRGNLFHTPCDVICITTNGFVKRNGEAVMGRGCAAQLAKLIPDTPNILGYSIRHNGNVVVPLCSTSDGRTVVAFPVKPAWREYHVPEDVVAHMRNKLRVGTSVPGWASTAIPTIIEESCKQLVALADSSGWTNVLLPRPGCGAGELIWEDIKPILGKYLDDRFTVVTH